ncbi:MAG: TauD/TfdA family dioxygenase [Gammaproteobacteria bacterium]|nr:TauD/TfdA family dioxygenase [Gammaproteobacteria bacterium]MDH5801783.1 TauD/TfdA family dioxygenase [Gammaproteobacteria bacterium]
MKALQKKSYGCHRSPFHPDHQALYRQWREEKLQAYPRNVAELIVPLKDFISPKSLEKQALLELCRKTNMAVYSCEKQQDINKDSVRHFCARFGLQRLDHNLCSDNDGISALQVMPGGTHAEYIPYSNHAINWHTDGYYNAPQQWIRGMVLHCVQPAQEGGINELMDPEMAYLLLRDMNPDYIVALMQEDAMSIPANVQNGVEIRPRQTGPVFSISESGDLHMRYTARTRSIEWKEDEATRQAVRALEQILREDSPFKFQVRLQAGQGLLSNNILHTRSCFTDDPDNKRLMFRARFYDRIQGSGIDSLCFSPNMT